MRQLTWEEGKRRVLALASPVELDGLRSTTQRLGAGLRHSDARVTHGLFISRVREFQPGDTAADIDHTLSWSTGIPPDNKDLVIEYQKSVRIPWWFILDNALTMNTGSDELKRLLAGAIFASLVQTLHSCPGDLAGLFVVDESGVRTLFMPTGPADLLEPGLRKYLDTQPGSTNATTGSGVRLTGIGMAARQIPEDKSNVIVISDLRSMSQEDVATLAYLRGTQHHVAVCWVKDRLEEEFDPIAAQISLQDVRTGRCETRSGDQWDRLIRAQDLDTTQRLNSWLEAARLRQPVRFRTDFNREQMRRAIGRVLFDA